MAKKSPRDEKLRDEIAQNEDLYNGQTDRKIESE